MATLQPVDSGQLDVWDMADEPIEDGMNVHLLASYLDASSMLHHLRSLDGLMRWRIRTSEEKLVVRYMRPYSTTSHCPDAACIGNQGWGMWSRIASVALQAYQTSDHGNCCGVSSRYQPSARDHRTSLADVGGEGMWG